MRCILSMLFTFVFCTGVLLSGACVHSGVGVRIENSKVSTIEGEGECLKNSESCVQRAQVSDESAKVSSEVNSDKEENNFEGRDILEISKKVPSIWPVLGNCGHVSSWFGMLRSKGGKNERQHKGIDIIVPSGSPIIATAEGIVRCAKRMSGYGNIVVIEHSDNLYSAYAHLSRILVKEGDSVKQGDIIGYSGATGRVTTPHLHYEVRCGEKALNPNWFFPATE
ncbi:MAG: M23 family metallopeptidase [Candidatus Hydrogenedentes bacterium]|nr:M23 family metallopeptidase [Candidatus Hydrogenedentota bacterium]